MKSLHCSIFIILVFLFGCTPTKTITYKTDNMFVVADSMRTDAELSIQTFDDKRKKVDDTQILFNSKRVAKIDDKKICFNSENFYETQEISQQLTSVLQEHFIAVEAFEEVYINEPSGNYQLTGDIIRLFGQQEFSQKAAVGSQFGLIGVLATSGVKTEGIFRITLANLQLKDTKSDSLYPLEDIDLQFEGEYSIDGDCWSVYNYVNEKLKYSVKERLLPAIIAKIQKTNAVEPS